MDLRAHLLLVTVALSLTLMGITADQAVAHMPLVRELAVSTDGERVALRMPGFGFVMRGSDDEFAYLCDALLGIEPGELQVSWVQLDDGSLWVGTQQGLRRVAADGCPDPEVEYDATPGLFRQPISHLARPQSNAGRLYATTATPQPELYRSDDGGAHWEARGPLPGPETVSGLVTAAHAPDLIYATQMADDSPTSPTTLAWSLDGGDTWRTATHPLPLLPLAVVGEDGLLARSHPAGGRGITLLRAQRPGDSLQAVQQLNFYGGFSALRLPAADPTAATATNGEREAVTSLWVGDEGGGLYRSADAGATFTEVEVGAFAPACLASGAEQLWACTAGLPQRPAVVTLPQPDSAPEPFLTLANVDHLVRCDAQLAVEQRCAAAFREWQADVLGQDPLAGALDTVAPASSTDAGPSEVTQATPTGAANSGQRVDGGMPDDSKLGAPAQASPRSPLTDPGEGGTGQAGNARPSAAHTGGCSVHLPSRGNPRHQGGYVFEVLLSLVALCGRIAGRFRLPCCRHVGCTTQRARARHVRLSPKRRQTRRVLADR